MLTGQLTMGMVVKRGRWRSAARHLGDGGQVLEGGGVCGLLRGREGLGGCGRCGVVARAGSGRLQRRKWRRDEVARAALRAGGIAPGQAFWSHRRRRQACIQPQ